MILMSKYWAESFFFRAARLEHRSCSENQCLFHKTSLLLECSLSSKNLNCAGLQFLRKETAMSYVG